MADKYKMTRHSAGSWRAGRRFEPLAVTQGYRSWSIEGYRYSNGSGPKLPAGHRFALQVQLPQRGRCCPAQSWCRRCPQLAAAEILNQVLRFIYFRRTADTGFSAVLTNRRCFMSYRLQTVFEDAAALHNHAQIIGVSQPVEACFDIAINDQKIRECACGDDSELTVIRVARA